MNWYVTAPHIQEQPKANETAYKPNEDVKLPCVADSDPELVNVLCLSCFASISTGNSGIMSQNSANYAQRFRGLCAHFYRATACNATHGIAKAFLSVCLSVRTSNAWIVTKRKKLVPAFLHHMKRTFIVVFRHEKRLVAWGTTPSTWNFGLNWRCSSKNADCQSIFARSASAVTPSEKVQSTLTGSPLDAFQWV